MTRRNRAVVASAALAVILSAAAAVAACGWTRLGLDFWNAPALREQVRGNLQQQAQLDEDLARTMANNRIRDRILRDLIAGRITVSDAARLFGELAESQPVLRDVLAERLRDLYPDATNEERLCRHVIDQARRLRESEPALAGLAARPLAIDPWSSSLAPAEAGAHGPVDSVAAVAGGV